MREDFPDWEAKFDRPDFVYGHRPNVFLCRFASGVLPREARVLSLAEGEGRNAVWLARRGHEVCAVDRSEAALAKLGRYAAVAGVEVDRKRHDVVEFRPGEAMWSGIVILHLHLPPSERRVVHRRAARALEPGGVLLLEALRPEQLHQPTDGPSDPSLLYTHEELRRDFASLEIKRLSEEDRVIHAGQHEGMTSVVNLIARRPG